MEIRILKKLFTEEEAEMYLYLTKDLQSAGDIAEKSGIDYSGSDNVFCAPVTSGCGVSGYNTKLDPLVNEMFQF